MCINVSTYVICGTPLLRDGLQSILSSSRYRVLGTSDDLRRIRISNRVGRSQLFILVSDGGEANIAATASAIRELAPESRIVLLSPTYSADVMLLAFQCGIRGCFVSSISGDALIKSLDVVMEGGVVFPSALLESFVADVDARNDRLPAPVPPLDVPEAPMVRDLTRVPALSERESLILLALVDGDSNKHIARRLNIAEATVKVHVKAILRKIRVRNRTQAAIWAVSNAVPSTEAPPLALPHADIYLAAAPEAAVAELAANA